MFVLRSGGLVRCSMKEVADWKVERLRASTMRRHTAPPTLADIGRDISVGRIL